MYRSFGEYLKTLLSVRRAVPWLWLKNCEKINEIYTKYPQHWALDPWHSRADILSTLLITQTGSNNANRFKWHAFDAYTQRDCWNTQTTSLDLILHWSLSVKNSQKYLYTSGLLDTQTTSLDPILHWRLLVRNSQKCLFISTEYKCLKKINWMLRHVLAGAGRSPANRGLAPLARFWNLLSWFMGTTFQILPQFLIWN